MNPQDQATFTAEEIDNRQQARADQAALRRAVERLLAAIKDLGISDDKLIADGLQQRIERL